MAARSIALFVEGSDYTDLRGRKPLDELWKELCTKLAPVPPSVSIFGITKAQIVALAETHKIAGSREALDILIERMYNRHKFDIAIVAFDRIPQNQHIPHGCLRNEVNFILQHFLQRGNLSSVWTKAAERLLRHYSEHPRCPRGPGRPPRQDLDVLYMDPMFEALLVADESAVLKAVGLKRRPKNWPKFDSANLHPDSNILQHAVTFAHAQSADKAARRVVRGDMKTSKHEWALRIVRAAAPDSRLFDHPIACRLRTLLT